MAEFTLFSTAIGDCGIAWEDDAVVAASLPADNWDATARRLKAKSGGVEASPPMAVRNAIDAVVALLNGEPSDLSGITCVFDGTDVFAEQVYALARAIPPGETTTYGAIATELGDIAYARRVGQALGRNPIPIIVPCHRVIGSDGKLVGFSADGGVTTKLRMLEIEGALTEETPSLFDDMPFSLKPRR